MGGGCWGAISSTLFPASCTHNLPYEQLLIGMGWIPCPSSWAPLGITVIIPPMIHPPAVAGEAGGRLCHLLLLLLVLASPTVSTAVEEGKGVSLWPTGNPPPQAVAHEAGMDGVHHHMLGQCFTLMGVPLGTPPCLVGMHAQTTQYSFL